MIIFIIYESLSSMINGSLINFNGLFYYKNKWIYLLLNWLKNYVTYTFFRYWRLLSVDLYFLFYLVVGDYYSLFNLYIFSDFFLLY